MYLYVDGEVCSIVDFQHHKPGKGGAFMRMKLKSLVRGRTFEKTYRAEVKVTQAILEKTDKQFLYRENKDYVFMDMEDYSQLTVPESRIGDNKYYLLEGETVVLAMYEGDVLDIELPQKLKMKVVKAEPGLRGDSATGSTKKVELETGLVIDVPLFIEQEQSIIVDSRTGEYVTRAD